MIMIITLILSFLIVLNFLLLIFSCNKTTKRIPTENPIIIKTPKVAKKSSNTQKIAARNHLAPTGS